jgi:hypothetical protein
MNNNGHGHRDAQKTFLGTGLAFPFQLNGAQRLSLVSGAEDIAQSIQIVLGTAPGERVMRPEFGCRAYELVFEPYDTATEALLIYFIEEALARWEPRIRIKKVEVEANRDEGRVLAHIYYTIKAIHDERSIVFPFFIESEGLG